MKKVEGLLSFLLSSALALGLVFSGLGAGCAWAQAPGYQAFFVSDTYPGYVIPYDVLTGSFGSSIPVGYNPTQVILSPDGSTAYVLNEYASSSTNYGSISVIDTATDSVKTTYNLNGLYDPYPYAGVISPDGKTLYITDGEYDVYAINAQTGVLDATYTLGASQGYYVAPLNLAISSTGDHVYVSEYEGGNNSAGALGIIDTQTGSVTTVSMGGGLSLPGAPPNVSFLYPYRGIALSGDTVFLSGYLYDSSTRTYGVGVVAINTKSLQATQFVEVASSDNTFGPGYLYLDPQGPWLYMPTNSLSTSTNGSSANGTVAINLETGALTPITTEAYSYAAAFVGVNGGSELYVAPYTGTGGTADVIDTNPQSSSFNQVVSTISGVPAYMTSIGIESPFQSNDVSANIEALAGPYSGSVASYLTNSTGCTPTFEVTTEPVSGDFEFSSATGSYTFTPPLGDLPASESFSWQATLPATCTADPGGLAAGTVTFMWTPAFGSIAPLTLTAGQSSGAVSFEVFSPEPVTITATSSNPQVVPPGLIDLSQGCQGTCTLNLTTGVAGTSTVTLTATEPSSGLTGSTTFSVAVAPAPTGGGGGGFGPWAVLGLLAFLVLRRRAATV